MTNTFFFPYSFFYCVAGILNRKLETTDDFDDDAMYLEGTTRGNRQTSSLSSKLSQIVPAKKTMLKVYSFSSRSFFLASQSTLFHLQCWVL